VLIVCRLYSAALSGLHIRIHIDNTIAVAAVNKGTAKGRTGPLMMRYIREIFWLSATHNFGLLASIFRATKANLLSDALSRGDFSTFSTTLQDWKLGNRLVLRSDNSLSHI
jgi:hypothetical protein